MQDMQENVEKYIKILYPEGIDKLSETEAHKVEMDVQFISEHIDEIDEYYKKWMETEKLTPNEAIANAVRQAKVDKYFEMLHPEYETMTQGRLEIMPDREIIAEHIDEVDKKIQVAVKTAERNGQKVDEHAIIMDIVEGLKTKQLTTQDIGKATINAPTTAKLEADQVENGERTKDNAREGEETRDDK